nr:HlyD family efflux transporter periplasmic adaptor subunit [uncultured Agathobaculum sp.]
MEQGTHNKRKRTGAGATINLRLIFIIAAIVVTVYFGMRIADMLFSFDTEPAVHIEVNDSFETTGWFFRDETPVSGSNVGSVRHIVYSGERVQKDAALAAVYDDERSLAISQEIEPIENRIELLDDVLETIDDVTDIGNQDEMITLTIQQIAEQLKAGGGNALASSVDSLRMLSLQNVLPEINTVELLAERDALIAERDNLEQMLSGRTTELTAPSSGYFSEIVDGYESKLTLQALDSLTIASFRRLIQNPTYLDNRQTIGKIVEGFTWYLVSEIPDEQAQRLQEGQNLRVQFTQASFETTVSVYSVIREHRSDTALLILEGTEFNSEIVSMRQQPIEIILATYSGLRVPKEAVRMTSYTDSDGNTVQQQGVYILSGAVQKFKIISDPLYETEDFYVVEQSSTNVEMLVEQDQIIVHGRNLQNNMVVR